MVHSHTKVEVESVPPQSEKRPWSPPILVCETYRNTAVKVSITTEASTPSGGTS